MNCLKICINTKLSRYFWRFWSPLKWLHHLNTLRWCNHLKLRYSLKKDYSLIICLSSTALAGAVKKTASCGLELPAKEFRLLATSYLKQVGRLNVAAIRIVADWRFVSDHSMLNIFLVLLWVNVLMSLLSLVEFARVLPPFKYFLA